MKFEVHNEYHGELGREDETIIYGFENISQKRNTKIKIEEKGGCFGYLNKGFLKLKYNGIILTINEGFYFSIPTGFEIIEISDKYQFGLWVHTNYEASIQTGYVEDDGRLNYIDGCKDSMLIQPIKKGNPCLNALFMPKGVNQTEHIHPSLRSGFIIKGGAKCEQEKEVYNLIEGQIFILGKDVKHKFRTDFSDFIKLKLVAFHPDSDFGAEDENHPMINRTIVEGVSASNIENIRTK
jgi:quercetin dioxygenase-like cupin family protein|tara:strand:- start:8152 stop:8865 length:714 start_codon:yes stop_codon:yes gene_type:complete